MPFNSLHLKDRLTALAVDGGPARLLVAFSGGLDSTVLLTALCQHADEIAAQIVAIHINHDLHADAGAWESHCREVAGNLAVGFECVSVSVPRDTGLGLEAAARAARYKALQQCMQSGDWLLSAHHEDDQAETFLLNLLRGSGMAGMAGIGEKQEFGPGFLLRPLLAVSQQELLAYAGSNDLRWLHDPSNIDRQFDRNFLRHEILPALKSRWPAASARLARSAALAGEATELLDQMADDDLQSVGFDDHPGRIEIFRLAELPDARQRNMLRRALKRLRLAGAPATRLRQILDELLPARPDAEPLVHWPGVEVRRYREHIYLQEEFHAPESTEQVIGTDRRVVDLGPLGRLQLVSGKSPGIDPGLLQAGLRVRFRQGGEEICPVGHECTHKLKKLLQQKGVVPWMRSRIPLLYAGKRIIAVADLWIAADAAIPAGSGLEWTDHERLF